MLVDLAEARHGGKIHAVDAFARLARIGIGRPDITDAPTAIDDLGIALQVREPM